MSWHRAGVLRYRSLLAVVAALAATLPSCAAMIWTGPQITVMTQNLFVGTGLSGTAGTVSWAPVAAFSPAWASTLASDFPARAAALADEIARARPDVVGLQEVTLWRDQLPSDVRTHPRPNATHVVVDFLATLQEELSSRGVPYTSVATSTNADLEVPRPGPGGGLVDLRVTDRDALLVRADVVGRTSNPRHGHYTAQVSDAVPTGPSDAPRGWTSIDYRLDPGTTVRIFDTHLEVGRPRGGAVQERQGDEVLAMIAASPYPVIALGDFNSPADGSGTSTYRNLTAVLHDAWAAARSADPGLTCCQADLLADAVGRGRARVDLVLTSEDWRVTHVAPIGDEPFRAAPPPLWMSDHVGVLARVALSAR